MIDVLRSRADSHWASKENENLSLIFPNNDNTRDDNHYHKLLPHQTRRHRIYESFVNTNKTKIITLKRLGLKMVRIPHFSHIHTQRERMGETVEVLDVVQWRQ